jgi:hypothetical protein
MSGRVWVPGFWSQYPRPIDTRFVRAITINT